jgi:hypothetical protein
MLKFLCTIDTVELWTAVIGIATTLYMVTTILILLAMRKQLALMEASNRPFVAPTIFKTFQADDGGLDITIQVENTGTIPATNVTIDWAILINDREQPRSLNKPQPAILLPSRNMYLPATFNKNVFDALKTKESIMQIVINISYQGYAEKCYTTYHKTKYDPSIDINAYVPIETRMD